VTGALYSFFSAVRSGEITPLECVAKAKEFGFDAIEAVDFVMGCPPEEMPEQAKRLIGYLPEQPPLYMNETPEEYLRFVGEAKGLRGTELERQIDEVIRQTGIEGVARRRISALSKGYKQRVGIAQALLGNPKVIILDEPYRGPGPHPDY
jgi:ABC-2 type transport system ATP-binding protein